MSPSRKKTVTPAGPVATATINRHELARALKITHGATTTKTALPALQCVLIEPDGERLRFITTNLESFISTTIPARFEAGNFTALVDHGTLENTVQTMGEVITLQCANNELLAESNSTRAKIKGIPPGEFPPPWPHGLDEKQITMPAAMIREASRRVAFAATGEIARPSLTGVHMTTRPGGIIRFEAADRFRLARWEHPIPVDPGENPEIDVLIPAKFFGMAGRIFTGGEIKVFITSEKVLFAGENTAAGVQLIEARFPDLDQVIPGEYPHGVTVKKSQLAGAVARAGIILAQDDFPRVDLILRDNENFVVDTLDREVGRHCESISTELVRGELPFVISANTDWIKKALDVAKSDSVELVFSENNRPLAVVDRDDLAWIHLIMPLIRDR